MFYCPLSGQHPHPSTPAQVLVKLPVIWEVVNWGDTRAELSHNRGTLNPSQLPAVLYGTLGKSTT